MPARRSSWLAVLGLLASGRASAQVMGIDSPAIGLCSTRPGFACIPYPDLPVPGNGALLIATVASDVFGGDGKLQVVVNDPSDGSSIDGNLLKLSDDFFAWHASRALEPDIYQVEVTDPTGTEDTYEVTFVEPVERAWPELMSAASLSQVIETGDLRCCLLDDGRLFFDYSCFMLDETRYVLLHPGLSSSSTSAELNQYLFRYTTAESTAPVVVPWATEVTLPLYETSDEYCYEIEAIDLVTGESHRYADLPARCAPHGTLDPLGMAANPLTDGALDSAVCPIPPDGLEARWCRLNRAACEVDDRPSRCHYYAYVCEDEPLPGLGWRPTDTEMRGAEAEDGSAELVDALDRRRAGSGADDGGSGEARAEPEPGKTGGAGGCAILRPHASLSRSLPMLLALCSAVCWGRAKQARRRRAHNTMPSRAAANS